jgi:hypothetical protein
MIVKRFDSIAALCAAEPSARNADVWECIAGLHNDGAEPSWWGVRDRAAAIDAVNNGWADGVKRLFDAMGHIEAPAPTSIRRRKARGDFGDEIDMQAVYAGTLDRAWRTRQRKTVQHARTVSIVMQVGAVSEIHAEQMFWRGAACVVLADALTQAGYNVEINGYSACAGLGPDDVDVTLLFPIKASTDPLDVAAIASVVCLGGFHRHFIFKARCAFGEYRADAGMGRSVSRLPAEYASESEPPIHCSLKEVQCLQTARAFVNGQLARYADAVAA